MIDLEKETREFLRRVSAYTDKDMLGKVLIEYQILDFQKVLEDYVTQCCSETELDYDSGKEDGLNEGYEEGYAIGRLEGFENGFKAGLKEGKTTMKNSFEVGSSEG